MGIGNFFRGMTMARDELDSQIYVVVFMLRDDFGWSEDRAHDFCMKDKGNKKRILHMRNTLMQQSEKIAEQINAGAIASGFQIA